MPDTTEIDDEIRAVLSEATAPRLIEEIAREVDDRLGCGLTPVERRVRELPDVEQGGRLWRLAKGESAEGSNTNHA